MDCVFCKIVNNELPSAKVYEDEDCFAFLDINPVSQGHTLLIPKRHYENMQEAPKDTLSKLAAAGQKVAKAIVEATGAQGYNFTTANGRPAGQSVFHVHFHIIPRRDGDGFAPWGTGKYDSTDEAQKVANAIREKIV